VAASGGILLASAAAYAFGTTVDTGAEAVTTGYTVAVRISQAPPTVFLLPGKSVPLHGTISNPNAAPVPFMGFTATIESVEDTHGDATRTCSPADYFVDGGPQLTSGDSNDIPALGQATWEGMTLHMLGDHPWSQADCKGAVVNIAYSATP
jgi:hypothetical protein